MTDDDRGPAIVAQESLQPLGGLEVQVVRRLVEQQQIGLKHQNLGQSQPGELPAAEGRGLDVVQLGLKAQRRQGHLNAGFVLVAAGDLEFVAEPVVMPHLGLELGPRQMSHFVRDFLDSLLESEEVLDAGVHLLQHRPLAAEGGLLGQIADPQALLPDDPAHVRGDLAGDQPQDGRFARTVGPDHADLLAGMELKVQMVQNDLRPERHVYILQCYNCHA